MVSLSVALATYNGEKFLRRQLESLAWQERLPDELVVCDDCSRDSTVAILREFAETVPFPVRISVNEHSLHFRRNFMKAANLCTSDVILFCDQDDVWRPGKIAAVAQAFEADADLLLVYHGATVVDLNENALRPLSSAAEESAKEKLDLPPPWHFSPGLIQGFRSELRTFDDLWPLVRDHIDGGQLPHDRWYFFLALAFGKLRFLDQDLLMYRQHGANLYGAERQRGSFARIFYRLKHDAPSDILRAEAAHSRAEVLEIVRSRANLADHRRIEQLQRAYDQFARRLHRRVKTYTRPTAATRLTALARSVVSGDYCGNPWGFDPLSVIRDFWLGVIRGGV